jgi:hypothetical protein
VVSPQKGSAETTGSAAGEGLPLPMAVWLRKRSPPENSDLGKGISIWAAMRLYIEAKAATSCKAPVVSESDQKRVIYSLYAAFFTTLRTVVGSMLKRT